jgi:hypothetical protein
VHLKCEVDETESASSPAAIMGGVVGGMAGVASMRRLSKMLRLGAAETIAADPPIRPP